MVPGNKQYLVLKINPVLGHLLVTFSITFFIFIALLPLPFTNPNQNGFQFFLTFSLFLAMGSVLTPFFEKRITLVTLGLQMAIAHATYSILAIFARAMELNFSFVIISWLILLTLLFILGIRRFECKTKLHLPSVFVFTLAIFLSVTHLAYPFNFDQGLLDVNIYSSFLNKNFSPGNLDMISFGVEETLPRMRANIFHALFALFGYISGIDPVFLVLHLAGPYFGFFLFVSTAGFIWELLKRKFNPLYPFLAVTTFLFFISYYDDLFYIYWQSYRLVNSATLDKDFCQFALIPAASLVFYKAILHPPNTKWMILLFFLLPSLVFTHPLAALYLTMIAIVIIFATLSSTRIYKTSRMVGLLAIISAFVFGFLYLNPSENHNLIDKIIDFDVTHSSKSHYWTGHYLGSDQGSVQYFNSPAIPHIRNELLFNNPLVVFSALCFFVWSLYIILKKPKARTHAVYGLCSSIFILLFCFVQFKTLTFFGYIILAAGVLFIFFKSIFPPNSTGVNFFQGYQLQFLNQISLLILHLLTTIILFFRPELWRGLERLSWFYFGYFSIAWVMYATIQFSNSIGFKAKNLFAQHKFGSIFNCFQKNTGLLATLAFIVGLNGYLALIQVTKPLPNLKLGSYPIYLGPFSGNSYYQFVLQISSKRIQKAYERPDAFSRQKRPEWLRENDRFLDLKESVLGHFDFYMYRKNTWYRQLYSEAFALNKIGESFFDELKGYYDLFDGKHSCSAIRFLKNNKVTIVITENKEYFQELERRGHLDLTPIKPFVFRINLNEGGHPLSCDDSENEPENKTNESRVSVPEGD